MTTEPRHQPQVFHQSAGAVVVGTEGCLVLRRAGTDEWIFPKGHLEQGEGAAVAAVREVHEETGLDIRLLGPLGTTHYAFGRDGAQRKRVDWFLAEKVGGTIALEPIFSEYAFLDEAGTQRLLTHDSDRGIARQAFALAARLDR